MICRHRAVSVDAYCTAVLVVVVIDPMALVTVSFWLSFGAVGWLLFVTLTQAPMGRFLRAAQLHCYLALGLTPLLGALHQSVPLVSPLANFIAVPIVAPPLSRWCDRFLVLRSLDLERCMGLSGGFGLGARAVGSADLATAGGGRFGTFCARGGLFV